MQRKSRITGALTGPVIAAAVAVSLILGAAPGAKADHQWSSYHFERDGVDPLNLSIGDNHGVSTAGVNWSEILSTNIGKNLVWLGGTMTVTGVTNEWNAQSGTHLSITEDLSEPANIESYNANYGNTGWLGIATIWITRGKNKHITRGESKVNDFYVTLEGYDGFDEPVEWQHVLCQEIGHTYGLDHNRDGETCMNDQERPLRYPTPNVHDDEMLTGMYAHDHGDDGGGGGSKKCHPVFGCPLAAHATWAEQFADDDEMFDAADVVVNATVLSSGFHRNVGRSDRSIPITQVRLRITDTLKGQARGVIVLEQTRGPGFEIEGDPGYVSGDDYTLFLREIGNNAYRTVNPDGRIRR